MPRDKIEQKAAALLDKAAEHVDEQAAKLIAKAEKLEGVSAWLASIDLWLRPEPPTRRPRFTREDIAAAAVRIADNEGLAGLSMRRLAAELDAGTMTLYHYVRGKDELLALVVDQMVAEMLVPEGTLPDDWRAALRAIAHRSREAVSRHPWLLSITEEPAPGPNMVRHFDQIMQAVAPLGLGLAEQCAIARAVDEYVIGYCTHARTHLPGFRDQFDETVVYLTALLERGDYPALHALKDDYGVAEAWRILSGTFDDPQRFDRSLDWLLDGFAASIGVAATSHPTNRTTRTTRTTKTAAAGG